MGTDDKRMFNADRVAWNTITAHHTQCPELPALCFEASQYTNPAREQFLRGLLNRQDLSRANQGFAAVSLGEYLVNKTETIEHLERLRHSSVQDEIQEYLTTQRSPKWVKDLDPAKNAQIKAESIQLFRDALDAMPTCP